MIQNKADFVLEYNEGLSKTLVSDGIDWSQTRVVFVSTNFTENQKEATNFKDIAIELWEVKRFDNGSVAITPILKSKSAESIKPIIQANVDLKSVAEEIKVYTEESNLEGRTDEVIELYEQFRAAILNLSDNIEIKPQKWYIAFKKDGHNICDIEMQKKTFKLSINLKKGQLKDSRNLMRDVSNIGHGGNGDYELKVADNKDIEYLMSLVKQAIVN